MRKVLKISADDTVAVALKRLEKGEQVDMDGKRITLMSAVPAGHKLAISAVGRKNSRLMFLAASNGICATSVSQRTSRLPPPTPSPDKKPSTALTNVINGIESSIDTENLPTE